MSEHGGQYNNIYGMSELMRNLTEQILNDRTSHRALDDGSGAREMLLTRPESPYRNKLTNMSSSDSDIRLKSSSDMQ